MCKYIVEPCLTGRLNSIFAVTDFQRFAQLLTNIDLALDLMAYVTRHDIP